MSSKQDQFRLYMNNLKASDPAIANELEWTMRTESAALVSRKHLRAQPKLVHLEYRQRLNPGCIQESLRLTLTTT